MPRKRRALRERILSGRPRLSDEMEEFLRGDNSAKTNHKLLNHLAAEKFFRIDRKGGQGVLPFAILSKAEQKRACLIEAWWWERREGLAPSGGSNAAKA